MCDVVSGKAQLHTGGADVHSGTGSIRIGFDFIPKSIEIASGCSISHESIERIGDPVAGNSDITLQHSKGCNGTDHEIILDDIIGLYTILDENVVALYSVTYVFLH
jgi:hypothetical protein